MKSKFALARTIAITATWLTILGYGFQTMVRYENTAGPSPSIAATWPTDSTLSRSNLADYNLVMFVHPRCPCSRASLTELAKLKDACPDLAVTILFLRPPGFQTDWEKQALWNQAAAIPGVRLVSDVDGREADNFRAVTSGQAALYDRLGKLCFAGGITVARGHEGDNFGRTAMENIVNGSKFNLLSWHPQADSASATTNQSKVFGCALKSNRTALEEGLKACLR